MLREVVSKNTVISGLQITNGQAFLAGQIETILILALNGEPT